MSLQDVAELQQLKDLAHIIGHAGQLEVAAALADGTMQGWVAQLPEDVGFKGVQAALALVAGQPVEPVISTDFIVITRDNLRDSKVQALLAGG